MPNKSHPLSIARTHLFKWEIATALLIKIALLIGLWFLIFRWMDRPNPHPDIADHMMPATPSMNFSQLNQEPRHVR
jgi:hypothetical protein